MKNWKKLLNNLFKSWYFRVALIGIVLRIGLGLITAHPDVWSMGFAGYLFGQKGIFNVWDFLSKLPPDNPLGQNYGHNFWTYPPLAYFTFGIFNKIIGFISPLNVERLMELYPHVYRLPGIGRHLLSIKLPYLLFDLGISWSLASMFKDEKSKRLAWLGWWLNPLSLYAGYLVGQFELMPTFFVVLSLLMVQKKKPILGAVSLGLGGAYKMFPLFFLPLLAVGTQKKFVRQVWMVLIGLAPFIISILPFVSSPVFRQVVLFSKQSEKFLHMSWPVSGAEGVSVFIFLWGIAFLSQLFTKKPLWQGYLAVMISFFAVTHYHPQWMVWLSPLVIIGLVKNKGWGWQAVGLMSLSWLVVTLLFEASLSYGAFLPLNPNLVQARSISEIIRPYYDPFQLMTIMRSLFAAAGLVFVLGQDKKFKKAVGKLG